MASLDITKLQALFEPLFPGLLGVELTDATPERVSATMVARANLCSGIGVLHWGAIVGLSQTLGSVGTVLSLPENARTKTISSNTEFHAEAPKGSTVTAECLPLSKSEQRMTWQTHVHNEAGELCAVVTQTQEITPED